MTSGCDQSFIRFHDDRTLRWLVHKHANHNPQSLAPDNDITIYHVNYTYFFFFVEFCNSDVSP